MRGAGLVVSVMPKTREAIGSQGDNEQHISDIIFRYFFLVFAYYTIYRDRAISPWILYTFKMIYRGERCHQFMGLLGF